MSGRSILVELTLLVVVLGSGMTWCCVIACCASKVNVCDSCESNEQPTPCSCCGATADYFMAIPFEFDELKVSASRLSASGVLAADGELDLAKTPVSGTCAVTTALIRCVRLSRLTL